MPQQPGTVIWCPRIEAEIARLVRIGWRRVDAVVEMLDTEMAPRYARPPVERGLGTHKKRLGLRKQACSTYR